MSFQNARAVFVFCFSSIACTHFHFPFYHRNALKTQSSGSVHRAWEDMSGYVPWVNSLRPTRECWCLIWGFFHNCQVKKCYKSLLVFLFSVRDQLDFQQTTSKAVDRRQAWSNCRSRPGLCWSCSCSPALSALHFSGSGDKLITWQFQTCKTKQSKALWGDFASAE